MQTNIASANIASQMGLALLNNDQQRAVQNATMVANIDLTKFAGPFGVCDWLRSRKA